MDAVVVRDLTYQYQQGSPPVLKDIAFQVKQGEVMAVAGLSGCGKSTLCHCISGIIRLNRDGVMAGDIMINGNNIREMTGAKLAFEAGIVFQDPETQLFSPTVEDEIAFAPENMCLPPDIILARVNQVIKLLGIEALRYANPCHLSGGEKHLVALAAVLALDPPLLILDEVMSQLDVTGKQKVAEALSILRDKGKTVVMVEHDLETVAFTDRMTVMEHGRIICCDLTASLLSDRNFLFARGLLDI